MERAGGLKRFLEVFRACTAPSRLRSGGAVGHGHHLHPMPLPILVPLVMALLGRVRIVTAIAATKVDSSLDFPAKVGLDHLLVGGVQGCDI